jgi:hypothetical protein
VASRVLTDDELEQLSTWPPEVARSDLAAYFTLSLEDLRWVRAHRGAVERIGLAVQLCGLGFLGFVPADLAGTPREVVQCLAKQVGVGPATFTRYAREVDGRTRRRHVAAVVERAGWRACGRGEWKALGDWLTARALEHDTPSVLFRQALQQFRADRVVRPGVDRLMRPGTPERGLRGKLTAPQSPLERPVATASAAPLTGIGTSSLAGVGCKATHLLARMVLPARSADTGDSRHFSPAYFAPGDGFGRTGPSENTPSLK